MRAFEACPRVAEIIVVARLPTMMPFGNRRAVRHHQVSRHCCRRFDPTGKRYVDCGHCPRARQ
ncbi:MAG: hypothetical protein ACLSFT_06460 [Ruminococcus callidus]